MSLFTLQSILICLSICLSIFLLSIFLSFFLSICLSFYPSICLLSIYLSIFLSIYVLFSFLFSFFLSTSRKCGACHEICTWPCKSASPATKPVPDLAKVRRLPRNLYMTLRKCGACHEICIGHLARPCQWDLRRVRASVARMPRMPSNLCVTLRKCCPCHKIFTSARQSDAAVTKLTLQCSKTVPRPPGPRRQSDVDRGCFQPAGDAETRRGSLFFAISIPTPQAHARFLAHIHSFAISSSRKTTFRLESVTRKFLLNFLRLLLLRTFFDYYYYNCSYCYC